MDFDFMSKLKNAKDVVEKAAKGGIVYAQDSVDHFIADKAEQKQRESQLLAFARGIIENRLMQMDDTSYIYMQDFVYREISTTGSFGLGKSIGIKNLFLMETADISTFEANCNRFQIENGEEAVYLYNHVFNSIISELEQSVDFLEARKKSRQFFGLGIVEKIAKLCEDTFIAQFYQREKAKMPEYIDQINFMQTIGIDKYFTSYYFLYAMYCESLKKPSSDWRSFKKLVDDDNIKRAELIKIYQIKQQYGAEEIKELKILPNVGKYFNSLKEFYVSVWVSNCNLYLLKIRPAKDRDPELYKACSPLIIPIEDINYYSADGSLEHKESDIANDLGSSLFWGFSVNKQILNNDVDTRKVVLDTKSQGKIYFTYDAFQFFNEMMPSKDIKVQKELEDKIIVESTIREVTDEEMSHQKIDNQVDHNQENDNQENISQGTNKTNKDDTDDYVQCANCGEMVPKNQKFCGSCGASMRKVCPSCGKVFDSKQKFCGECGAKLEP